MNTSPNEGSTTTGPKQPSGGRRSTLGLIVRAVQVRLRFIAVLAVAFLVVGQWDTLWNRWEQLTRGLRSPSTTLDPVSTDTEYFCPMDPGVVSDWPGKCGVCNMALVRRKKGEAAPLPSGVVARMQFSPYRLSLAGVRTSPVDYQPLAREVEIVGTAVGEGTEGRAGIALDGDEPELAALRAGQRVDLAAFEEAGRSTLLARVTKVGQPEPGGKARLDVRLDEPARLLREGTPVTVVVRHPIDEQEPLRSLPSGPPPLRQGEPRSIYVCGEHPEVVSDAPGRCPVDGKSALEPQPLRANQRVGWWCPMHPKVTADRAGQACGACGGMKLVPRVVTYRPPGQVLAIPESAVVDTGTRSVVFVERMPGMFDSVEIVVGPRCGGWYPVVRGLEPGQRVALAGAFLIDAETRLNPALASAYFGAARSEPAEAPRAAAPASASALAIPPALRAQAEAQRVCPVTGKPLGSMGPPVEVRVAGRTVLVCCEGCRDPLTSSPEKYLAKLDAAKAAAPVPLAPAARP